MDRLDFSLDRSVYYTLEDSPEIRSIPNALEKNISNLFSDILDDIRKNYDFFCEEIEISFIDSYSFYFGSKLKFVSEKLDVLRPEDSRRSTSFIRPLSIAHARRIRVENIGKSETTLIVRYSKLYEDEEPVIEDLEDDMPLLDGYDPEYDSID